ncbi:unnamed protein product [Onchocerca flexuosa]|uniref:Uncharacterized protein n=1 Tax=Onchocerca flexuosa TaxID=387005 RepID=A0A3P7W248_9BILA|nr:unnamed protein product [Onchocerca flexuosa]
MQFSSGKRCSKKIGDSPSVVEQTYAQADSEAGASSYLKAQTIISRWQGSFDESYGDGEAATNVDCLRIEKSDNSGSKYSPLIGKHCSSTVPPFSRSSVHSIDAKSGIQTSVSSNNSNLPPYNVRLFAKTSESPSTLPSVAPSVPPPQIAVTPPVARALFTAPPQTTAPTKTTFQPLLHAMAPTSSTVQSASASLMMHFKNLVNTFNSFTNNNGATAAATTPSSSNIFRPENPSELKRFSLDNAISLQYHRSPVQFSTVHNVNNDKNNETVTNLNDSKDSNTDPEKELRRQRRLRRRSICQEIFSSNEPSWKNSIKNHPETDGQTGNIGEIARTVKKSTSEKHLFNNGSEVTSTADGRSQVMEDAKWHILNLRSFTF